MEISDGTVRVENWKSRIDFDAVIEQRKTSRVVVLAVHLGRTVKSFLELLLSHKNIIMVPFLCSDLAKCVEIWRLIYRKIKFLMRNFYLKEE